MMRRPRATLEEAEEGRVGVGVGVGAGERDAKTSRLFRTCSRMICAPAAAASRTTFSALARLASTSDVIDSCVAATVTRRGGIVILRASFFLGGSLPRTPVCCVLPASELPKTTVKAKAEALGYGVDAVAAWLAKYRERERERPRARGTSDPIRDDRWRRDL